MRTAPFIGISRHRLATDGQGIRTLIAFHGCPLSCKYCLNPSCLEALSDKIQQNTSEEIIKILRKDALYFLATKGGVTFGGGEPLLHAEFILEVIENYSEHIDVTLETSLNVPRKNLEILLPYIQTFIVDIKDMNPAIYKAYTGQENALVKANLALLLSLVGADRVTVRVPRIPDFNTAAHVEASVRELQGMGVEQLDLFDYKIPRPRG